MKTLIFPLLLALTASCTKPTDFYGKNQSFDSSAGSPNGLPTATGKDDKKPGRLVGGRPGTQKQVAVTEDFNQPDQAVKDLDILWVVDNSGSMTDEQIDLGKHFDLFIKNFMNKNINFKMAITTTDATPEFNGLMVEGSDTKLTSAAAKADPAQFLSHFNELVKVGVKGSGEEKGLQTADAFVKKYGPTFLRSNAYLAVVIISDEEDQSALSPAEYATELKKVKSNPGLVKVYSIVDKTLSNPEPAVTVGFKRYAQASEATAGTVLDIRESFSNTLTEMSEKLINLMDSFALANQPVDGSLKVFVNGILTTDYAYDLESQSILFHHNSIPGAKAKIKVTYLKNI
ncbi:MAG TPA: vWA domain-containing protein [Bacteriovoracaceae bacterium]|nr:vWA domain-containing protein [Bacteriovoracaceae bacterium]